MFLFSRTENLKSLVLNSHLTYRVRNFHGKTLLGEPFTGLKTRLTQDTTDFLIFSNGPIHFVGWCSDVSKLYLAVSSNNDSLCNGCYFKSWDLSSSDHPTQQRISLPADHVVQIWEFSENFLSDSSIPTPSEPEMILRFSRPIRQAKWIPQNVSRTASSVEYLDRIGILGICFANGDVGVFSIPKPSDLRQRLNIAEGTSIHVRPTPLSYSKCHSNTSSTLCIDWCLSSKEPILLSGGTDGTVRIHDFGSAQKIDGEFNIKYESIVFRKTFWLFFKLRKSEAKTFQECFDEFTPIRVLATSPDNPNLFAAGSTHGLIGIWDRRFIDQPIYTFVESGGSPVRDIKWVEGSLSLIVSGDYGVRLLLLTDNSCTIRTPIKDCSLDDIAVHVTSQLLDLRDLLLQ